MKKERGADATPKSSEEVDLDRLVNRGEVVTTSRGDVLVRELGFDQTLDLVPELMPIIENLEHVREGSNADVITALAKSEKLRQSFRRIMASATSKDEAFYADLPLVDWLKIIATMKRVIRWSELRDLFFELVPQGVLDKLKSLAPSQ